MGLEKEIFARNSPGDAIAWNMALEQVYYNPSLVTEIQVDAYCDRMRTENALYAMTALAQSLDRLATKEYSGRIQRSQFLIETLNSRIMQDE